MPAIKKKFPQNEKERNDWRDFAMKNEIIKNAIELFAKRVTMVALLMKSRKAFQ